MGHLHILVKENFWWNTPSELSQRNDVYVVQTFPNSADLKY